MKYTVFLEPIRERGWEGYYYARIPTLDLTTHGRGEAGALQAARELLEVWLAERAAHQEPIPREEQVLIREVEVPDALLRT
jgi:predicted RNase H-like HicB family nuclease